MKSPKLSRDKFPMKMDAIRIDWNKAIGEVEHFIESEGQARHRRSIDNMDAMMYGMGLLCEIRDMYRKDDIDGYLKLLDVNRHLLKIE